MKLKVSLLSIMILLLSFLSYGTVKEFGKDFGYDAQYAFSIREIHATSQNKMELFKQVDDFATKNQLIIYKSILDNNSQQQIFAFGKVADKKYVTDKQALAMSPVTGVYYANKNLDASMEAELANLGFEIIGHTIGWYLIPIYFLFSTIRALAVWTLFFIFGSLLLAVKILYRKKIMIYRSIGLFQDRLRREFLQDMAIITGVGLVIVLLSIAYYGGWDNVFTKSFVLLMGTNVLTMIIISILTNIIFGLSIKYANVLAIIKNMKASPFITTIWLVVIILSIFISSMTISKSVAIVKNSADDIALLGKWSVAKDYLSILWMDNTVKDGSGAIDKTYMEQENAKNIKFLKIIGEENYIYRDVSSFGIDNAGYMSDILLENLKKEHVDIKLANHVHYVNKGFIIKNQQLYPQYQYDTVTNKGVIYVPQRYQSKIEAIKRIIKVEQFYYNDINLDDYMIKIVPDNQKVFLFNYKLSNGEVFSQQEQQNIILVQLSIEEILKEKKMSSFVANIVFNAIYNKQNLENKLNQVGLVNYSDFTNVSENMIIQKEALDGQLQGTKIVLAILSIAQIFIIYQYITTLIKNNAKRLAVLNLFGKPTGYSLFKLLIPLLTGIIITMCILLYNKVTVNILSILMLGYSLEIMIIALVALYNFKKKQVQILKGDFEVL